MIISALLVALAAGPQPAPPPARLTREGLSQISLPPAGATTAAEELTIDWSASAADPAGLAASEADLPRPTLTLLSRRSVAGGVPRERRPEVAADRLLVVAADDRGAPVWWRLQADPRIVRSEGPGADGLLTGVVLYRRSAVFSVALPAEVHAVEIRLYQPRQAAGDWEFDLVGTVRLDER